MTSRPGSATVTTPSDTEILITRSFEAPAALAWETLTRPEHVLRWWGPSWAPIVRCDSLRILVVPSSRADRDGHLEPGMGGGMQETFDRLDSLLDGAA